MHATKIEPTIKRSRAAALLDKTPRTLVRYEAQGLLTPIKLNCRAVVYLERQVQRLLSGQVQTAPDRISPPMVERGNGGQFARPAPRRVKHVLP